MASRQIYNTGGGCFVHHYSHASITSSKAVNAQWADDEDTHQRPDEGPQADLEVRKASVVASYNSLSKHQQCPLKF